MLKNLGGRADEVLVGGKMAEELRDENPLPFPVVLPTDVVAASAFEADAETRVSPFDAPGRLARPRHRPRVARRLRSPDPRGEDGLLERPDGCLRMGAVRRGTKVVAQAVASVEGYTVVGGGDSVRAVNELGLDERDLVGLDRRRRVARAARGQGAPRRRRDPGELTPMLIAGNWKMFKGPAEARAFFDGFEAPDGVDVVFCPPFVSLAAAVETGQTIYAQNVHWEPSGAYTGEVSPEMLLELGVQGARRPLRAAPAVR